jgi:thermitase
MALKFVVLAPSDAAAAESKPFREGIVLVQPRVGLPPAAFERILSQHGGQAIERRLQGLNVYLVQVPPQAEEAVARALAKNPHIAFAEVDMAVPPADMAVAPAALTPNDPQFNNAWHLPQIGLLDAWSDARGDGILVAVLDTGVDGMHPDLADKLEPGWNVASDSGDTSDVNGHGTTVAGTVAAATDNATGVASVAWNARILPVRITDRGDGWASYSDIADGLRWAADQDADVANISYAVSNSGTVTNAASYMKQAGGVVVVAGGNDGTDPGYSDNAAIISVSATTSSDSKASWSNYGDFIDVAAPGVSILTTTRSGGYGNWSGTSFASPVAAGVVSLVLSADPTLTPDEAESILEQSALDVAGTATHPYYGHGRVDAAAAVALALQGTSPDTEAPTVSIFEPVAGAAVSDLVSVSVSATDNVGVSEVQLFAGGQLVGSDLNAPYEFSWDSTQVADGPVILSARGLDAAGNEGIAEITVTVDNSSASAPLTVASITPSSLGTNTTAGVEITGSAFAPGASLVFENGKGPAPSVSGVLVVDETTLTANVQIQNGGPPKTRYWDVLVTNPDGASATLPGGLTVTP